MRTIHFAVIFVLLYNSTFSQSLNFEKEMGQPYVCSYYGEEVPASIKTYSPADDGESIIESILAIVGLKPNFVIRAADIPNAAAVIVKNKRLVLYNPDFVANLNEQAGNRWAAVSILAHEVGHHLNGHTLLSTGSRPDIELEADEFSGFILRKMGATLSEAQSAMKIAASIKQSHTHPGKAHRLDAIAKGWTNADEQIAGKISTPARTKQIEKPVIRKEAAEGEGTVLAEKYIAYDVEFNADSKGKYYVTIRNNLVKVQNDELYIAGILAQSNRKKYAGMFYDKHYNYLYITSRGDIVNGSDKKIGTIRKHLTN